MVRRAGSGLHRPAWESQTTYERPALESRHRVPSSPNRLVRSHTAPQPAVAPSRVVPSQLTYGGDAPTRLDRHVPQVFALVPITGEVLVDGTLRVTSRTPAVLAAGDRTGRDAPTLLWYPDTTAMAFQIDAQAIRTELASLLYEPVGESPSFERSMDLNQPSVNNWIQLAMIFASELRRPEGIAKNPMIGTDMERILIRCLLLSQPNNYSPRLTTTPVPSVVSAAIAAVQTDATRAYTTAMLADRAGVSVRSLQTAFRQHLGMTPLQYLRQVRLSRAREDLLASRHSDGATVSAIASRWGFTHLGRFAQDYRSRYGESPSQTLRGYTGYNRSPRFRPTEPGEGSLRLR
jgi:AraC-like DNA-binding protein